MSTYLQHNSDVAVSKNMNKNEAITKFVKKNFISLTSSDLDRSSLKAMIRDFFVMTHKKKFGHPKAAHICESLVRYQVKNGVPRASIDAQFDLLPIYKDLGTNKIVEFKLLLGSDYESSLSEEEMSRIDKSEAYGAIKAIEGENFRREFKKDNLDLVEQREKLKEDISRKKDEFLSIPSILDESVIDEPDFSPEAEDVKSWWEKFYLKSNPFPGNKDGLSKIESSLYEQVVVKTKPYQTLLSRIDKNISTIFDTAYMLVGDFGFGKTTLQDYMSHYLVSKNILPVRITCIKAQPDANGYFDYFNQKLIRLLAAELGGDAVGLDASDPDLAIEMCSKICEKRDGVVIFLDDYHKHRSEFLTIYDFLGTLQILKDQLTRDGSNVGFVVSAIPLWLDALSDHQQMSGFFDSSPIVMPSPTPEYIRKIFNQRISAYCYDSSPREIQIEFIEHIFNKSEGKGNYRDYLNRIIEELDSHNMAIVSSPIEVDEESLAAIRLIIKSDSTVWSPLQKLLHGSRFKKYNTEQISKCLELLVIAHTQSGINEGEPIFSENKFYFSRLKDTGLITKRKDSSTSNEFCWTSSPSVNKCSESIKLKFGLNLQDYFLKIFSNKESLFSLPEEKSEDSVLLSKFKSFINECSSVLNAFQLENIENAIVLHDKFDVDPSSSRKTDQAVSDMRRALNHLSSALFDIDGSLGFFDRVGVSDLSERWEQHQLDGEIVEQFVIKSEDYSESRDSIQYSLSSRKAKDAFNFIFERIRFVVLDEVLDSSDRFGYGLIHKKQNPLDVRLYDSIRGDIYSQSKEVRSRLIGQSKAYVETLIKEFLYASTVMVFGEERYFKSAFPSSGARDFTRNSSSYTEIDNRYADISRDDLKDIFINGSPVKALIVDSLDLDWSPDCWYKFFDVFTEDSSGELLVDQLISSTYYKLLAELIGAMNTMVSRMPVNGCFVIQEESTGCVDDAFFKSGFIIKNSAVEHGYVITSDVPVFKKDQSHELHILNPVMYERVKKLILSKVERGFFTENMLGVSFIQNHYKVKYYEFVLSLVFMAKCEKVISISGWFGSHMLIERPAVALSSEAVGLDIDAHHFDVALSFPGEARDYVYGVSKELHVMLGKDTYFYDNNYRAHLARPDLDTLLQDIYGARSRLVVVFLSEDYEKKAWCGLEFRAIKQFIMDEHPKKVMLVKVGEGDVKGIFKTDGYINGPDTSERELAGLINERLKSL